MHPRFSPDGKQLLVASNETGKYGIYLVNTINGERRRLTGDSIIAVEPFWSPDGKQIGYRSNYRNKWSVVVHSLITGKTRPVFESDSIILFGSDWAPDGKRLAFTGTSLGKASIYTLDLETSSLKKATNGGDEYYPRWNHREDELTYFTGKYDSIMVLNFTTGTTRCINKGKFSGWSPCFSPDNRKLAFISEKNGHWDLWATSVSNPLPTQLTKNGFDDSPDWSPDGESIVISRLMTVNQLYRLQRLTSSVEQVTNAEFDQIDYRMSSDAYRIVFGRIVFGDELWIEDLRTEPVKQLTVGFPGRVKSPYWSPTEDSVVFINQTFFPGGSNTDLFLVDTNSGSTLRITETGSATNPVWANDGKIYFSQRDDRGFNQICRFNPGTLETQQITDGAVNRIINDVIGKPGKLLFENNNGLFTLGSEGDNKIAKGRAGTFSPDGTLIAFISNLNEEKWDDIYTVDVKSGETTRLTNDRYSENTLSWSEDGASIFFNANRGDKDIWIIKLKQ